MVSSFLCEPTGGDLCRAERDCSNGVVAIVADSGVQAEVLEGGAGARAGEGGRHGDGIRAEIGVGGITGGVVYELGRVVRVLPVAIKHRVHCVACPAVPRHSE